MPEERDDVIDRIVNELKTLPAVRPDAAASVLARIEAARHAGAPADDGDDVIGFPTSTDEMLASPAAQSRPAPIALVPSDAAPAQAMNGRARRLVLSLPAAIGYALAATLAGFLIRGALPTGATGNPQLAQDTVQEVGVAALPNAPAVARVANAAARDEAPVPVQFVLDARRASRVSLVGDFNGWDATADSLARDPVSGLWSTVVPVPPGRHVYAFLVDSVWTLDPRAPKATDADYGTQQSVLIVGTP